MKKPIKRCWVHIGMHKTGTTSIQKTLGQAQNLPGWHYAKIGNYTNNGVPLHAMFATEPFKYHWFAKKGYTPEAVAEQGKRWREELHDLAHTSGVRNLLISAEGAILIDEEGLCRMRDFLQSIAKDVRIIGYIRAPIAHASSMLQQHIKMGRDTFDPGRSLPVYRRRLKRFDRVFGRKKVILRKFDPATFPNGCVVTDFCQQLGIPLPAETGIVRANESLSRNACGMLFAYRKYGPGYGSGAYALKENSTLIKALLKVKGTKFKLAPGTLQEQLAARGNSIRWMEKRLKASLHEEAIQGSNDIATEADLLTLEPGSLASFIKAFEEVTGLSLASKLPPFDESRPEDVAAVIEACRQEFSATLPHKKPHDLPADKKGS